MINIGITGIEGLIGWHLHAFLYKQPNVQVVKANRATFASKEELYNFVASSDVVVHLAGMNRGDENDVAETNIRLADDLIAACERSGSKPHIVFASSTQIYRNTVYGNSKKVCTEGFQKWSERTGALFTNMILPNVFGESGKPFYNSVVSTFCYQLANGQEPEIVNDTTLDMLHAQQVANKIYDIINTRKAGDVLLKGTHITVSELLAKLKNFAGLYEQHIIPDLRDDFNLHIFNTYRSYLYPTRYPVPIVSHNDSRGTLFEAVKSSNGGQTFISTTRPGVTRGNHYHTKKIERFLVLSGQAEICIRKLFSSNVVKFNVEGTTPQYIDIPTLHSHNITNTGRNDLITLFWSNEILDPAYPDTFVETV
ncbi:MAG: NAD-dependent epimerase/dehydratase family protein [Candidatus Methanoperedens sp.]